MANTDAGWEWRTFGGGHEDAERRIRALPAAETAPRRATHIVCDMSGAELRLADGELILRMLRRVSGELEQWKTVIRATFPLDALTARRTFGYLELRPPITDRESYTLHQFASEIVEPQHALTSVEVGQIRHTATLHGCEVDVADVTLDGMSIKTIGVSGNEPAAVNETLAELGLTAMPNENIVAALKHYLAGAAKP